MEDWKLFLIGVVMGQVLSLTIITVTTSQWFRSFVYNLRHSIMLYRVKRAYRRINRATDHVNRLLNV